MTLCPNGIFLNMPSPGVRNNSSCLSWGNNCLLLLSQRREAVDRYNSTLWFLSLSRGPDGVQLENANSSVATVAGLQVGTYVFTLTVRDERNLQSQSSVNVIVKEGTLLPWVGAAASGWYNWRIHHLLFGYRNWSETRGRGRKLGVRAAVNLLF